jgi:hypothetical protein
LRFFFIFDSDWFMAAYSTVASVKMILQIASAEIVWDTEIEGCITSADALIDSLLKKLDLNVPSPVPQNIADASAYFAAWLFRRRRDPLAAEGFWVEANRFLDAYATAEGEVAFKVAQA